MLDIANRIIDNDTYPVSQNSLGNVPSIFFNDRGHLFGIGTNLLEEDESRGYYQFDLTTGQPELLQELEIERNQDACSCPYYIKILNEVRPRKNSPCTEIAFEITLINRTLSDQVSLTLSDTFPPDLIIESIENFSLDGTIIEGVGSNIMEIQDLYLPVGVFSFEVILQIDENTSLGDFENQITLSDIQLEELEFDKVVSDDPLTPFPNDATKFSIAELNSTIGDQFFGICEGGETTIHTGVYGANTYRWSTGETTEEIVVDAAGEYHVTITTDCDQTVATAMVTLDELSLEVGENQFIESGETILIEPTYQSHTPITTFSWETDNLQTLDCPSCKNLYIQGVSDTQIQLYMENATGCTVNDGLDLEVVGVKVYSPNIFSPSSEGINSTFFLQGNLDYNIASLEIYDRWGNLMFQNKNFMANQPENGWDGTHNGQACKNGVYVWMATLRYKDGTLKLIAGDVTLVK